MEETNKLKQLVTTKVLEERGYALVWMSAGNSYFKEDIIEKILDFTGKHFSKTIVMAPDEPAEHTFKALGYEGNDIKRKARLNANRLQNRAIRVISTLQDKERFKVVEWIEEIIPNQLYQNKLKEIQSLYSTNEQFRKDALEATTKVLESKTQKQINLKEAAKEGVNYLLKELAFVLASPEIYNTQKITYIYHHDWPIFQKLIAGFYDRIKKQDLNFIVFK
ncbi:MAG: tRNA-dependent cyclodipeptide synthase [Nanoarchaeota archaeon]|nr:tRNA-dependent cyclodipeptide synthase [Nanoarchaeota archaeon]MBU0977808.1 tRNA-dependent cyclodipeptide synthase [Nanoarchaeota archaeon]